MAKRVKSVHTGINALLREVQLEAPVVCLWHQCCCVECSSWLLLVGFVRMCASEAQEFETLAPRQCVDSADRTAAPCCQNAELND
jgi:hypothetical protein